MRLKTFTCIVILLLALGFAAPAVFKQQINLTSW